MSGSISTNEDRPTAQRNAVRLALVTLASDQWFEGAKATRLNRNQPTEADQAQM